MFFIDVCIYMCGGGLYTRECSDPGGQKRAQDPPKMELKAFVGC